MELLVKNETPYSFVCVNAKNLVEDESSKDFKELKDIKDLKEIRDPKPKLSTKSPPKKVPLVKDKDKPLYYDCKVILCVKEIQKKKFLDYVLEGMNVAFSVAIDYSSSNLDPKNPDSLHTLKMDNNKYCKAIKSCGKILQNYDRYLMFNVFGFAGLPSKKAKEVSQCFPLNGKPKDPSIKGLDAVINTYKESLKVVELVGPTYFQHIVKNIVEITKKSNKSEFSYQVFLILTDGKVEDMNETLDALVEASKLPISIIIVGIGSGDFGKMDTLGI
jgi:hypothetical protein